MSYRLILGYKNYKQDTKIDWRSDLIELAPLDAWKDIYHLVIVPTYKEDLSILESSVESVIKSDYPMDKVIYVLATEERDKENAEVVARSLQKKYAHKLCDFITIMHPKDIPGEVIGKGPNITYSGKKMVEYFEKKKIPFENVIVTTMDSDNRMDRRYLACLTYKYLSDSDPIHKSFQPLPM
jgi:cellulose synthase/poly-beta-1,6-N-acetylglucosamine synthase-like glycosyltransferase